MAIIQVKQLNISGSNILIGSASVPYMSGYLNPSMSISDALNVVAVQGSGTIGTPDDGTYTDGFFNYWTPQTRIPNAFDDINELLFAIAPASPSQLSGDLDVVTSVFSGRLAGGLNSDFWYVAGYNSGSLVTTLASDTIFLLDSPNQSTTFNAGTINNFFGGITASYASGTSDFIDIGNVVYSTASLPIASGSVSLTAFDIYNGVWYKANAQIDHIVSVTGSSRFRLTATGASQSSDTVVYYVGTSVDHFPEQSFTGAPNIAESSINLRYLSGITYYGSGSVFNINYTAADLYSPVYVATAGQETLIASSYFTNTYVGTSSLVTPQWNWDLTVNQLITLSNNVASSFGSVGTYTVTLYKPNKISVSDTDDIGTLAIDTYVTRSTLLVEYFNDEVRRYYSETSKSWDSTVALIDGQLQVQNGRLIDGQYADYPTHTGNDNYYYRYFTPQNGNVGGTITILKNGIFVGSTILGEWGSSAELQMAFFIDSEAGANIYDLGRAVGDNSGSNVFGIRDGAVSGDTITWGLPTGKSTDNSDPLILAVRFVSTTAIEYLTRLTVTFNNG